MNSTDTKLRTITLTDRAPVEIDANEWPTIAIASGDSYSGSDYAKHQQARSQGEIDTYTLRARKHADGRVLVYGVLDAAIAAWQAPAGGEDRRAGALLAPANGNIAATIRSVGEQCRIPDHVIRDCIASLPAERI